jgi:anti-sigma factor RsiW
MAKTLAQNPNMRRCVLSDNKIGEEGGSALAEALAVNTSLQVRRRNSGTTANSCTLFAWLRSLVQAAPLALLLHEQQLFGAAPASAMLFGSCIIRHGGMHSCLLTLSCMSF